MGFQRSEAAYGGDIATKLEWVLTTLMDGNELSRIAAVLQMTVDTVGAARDRLRGAAIEAWPRLATVFDGDMRD